jgi:protein-S-isoprenylcysteine O-methyltransferase Ste14
MRFLPPHALLLGMALIYIFGKMNKTIYFLQVLVGVIAMGVSCCIIYAIYKHHSSCWSQIPISQVYDIIDVWPYTFTRNPVHLSLLLFLASAALFTNYLFNLIIALIYFTYTDKIVIPEHESNMLKCHRNKYSEYCLKVSRWGV